MEHSNKKNNKPVIGITMGDINGVGPEIIIKVLSDNRLMKLITPVVYGSTKVLSYYRKNMDLEQMTHFPVRDDFELHTKKINVKNCWEETFELTPGQATNEGGTYAFKALVSATKDLTDGKIDALVTAPINKKSIQREQPDFIGHTEYITEEAGRNKEDSVMLLVSPMLRVGVATGHIPLSEVKNVLTKELIEKKLNILIDTVKKDFGAGKPKIAVLGVNPHAGEDGLLGKEEKEIITPVINAFKDKGQLVFGPFPSDGFFGTSEYKKYDAVLAMYHDQGLIPFKTLAFEEGVNYTAGLPIIRTSPDHGTAYDIAGKNKASEESIRHAIFLALDVIKSRSESGN